MDVMVMTFYRAGQEEKDHNDERVRDQSLTRCGMMAQKRLEWINRDYKTYVKTKRTEQEEGSGEQRIGTPLQLEYDMYGLIYVTTLFPEYLYVCEKTKKAKDEAKAKIDAARPPDDQIVDTTWLKHFENAKGKKIPQDVARELEKEKHAFEEKIKKIKEVTSPDRKTTQTVTKIRLSDDEEIGTKKLKWRMLKHWALTENYHDQPWYLPLDDENKDKVEALRTA